jgi:uncharacterized cupin superfamily protein
MPITSFMPGSLEAPRARVFGHMDKRAGLRVGPAEDHAPMEATLSEGVPVTAGWFVVNARDVPWWHNDLRSLCRFGGQGEAHFDDLGIALYALGDGQAMSMYHHEAEQEDFLVLRGEPTAIVEGAERRMQPWDLLHCPPLVAHTIVGPGLILAVGARKERGSACYPVEPAAIRHGAGIASPDEVPYARFGEPVRGPAPDLGAR